MQMITKGETMPERARRTTTPRNQNQFHPKQSNTSITFQNLSGAGYLINLNLSKDKNFQWDSMLSLLYNESSTEVLASLIVN